MPSQEETLAHLVSAGYLKSKRVIHAMEAIRREDFLPEEMKMHAWEDHPLPIGFGQTMSAPHMYAFMAEAANVSQGEKILEVGTGSGYGAALLSFLAGKKGKVCSIELVPELAGFARKNIAKSGMAAEVIEGDGSEGYPRAAPYGKIIVTAACDAVPPQLLAQLKAEGKMLVPVGRFFQDLLLVEKTKEGKIEETRLLPVMFVPLVRKE